MIPFQISDIINVFWCRFSLLSPCFSLHAWQQDGHGAHQWGGNGNGHNESACEHEHHMASVNVDLEMKY